MVKNLPAMQETQVLSLGQEDPLEEEMATHSSILVWEIPWTEEPGGFQATGSQRDTAERLSQSLEERTSESTVHAAAGVMPPPWVALAMPLECGLQQSDGLNPGFLNEESLALSWTHLSFLPALSVATRTPRPRHH